MSKTYWMALILLGVTFMVTSNIMFEFSSEVSNPYTESGLSAIQSAEILLFYFLSKTVSQDGKRRVGAPVFWFVFEKIIVVSVVGFSIIKLSSVNIIYDWRLWLVLAIVADPMNIIGKFVSNLKSVELNYFLDGICKRDRKSLLDYLPAFAIIAMLCWLVLRPIKQL